MPETSVLLVLYVVGVLMLVSELFIPSHGILTLAGLGFLGIGIYYTFQDHGRDAGVAALLTCMVGVPALAVVAVKYWPNTWVGRKIVPPNPTITNADTSVPVDQINSLIGESGVSVSPLRPVGVCEFKGQRISCIATFGMIEAGVAVQGVGIQGTNLAVAPA